MTYEEAKEFAMEFKSVVNQPFAIVSDLDLPTLFFVEIDALHCILLGVIYINNSDFYFILLFSPGPLNDILFKLENVYFPRETRQFFADLCLDRDRGNMPGDEINLTFMPILIKKNCCSKGEHLMDPS